MRKFHKLIVLILISNTVYAQNGQPKKLGTVNKELGSGILSNEKSSAPALGIVGTEQFKLLYNESDFDSDKNFHQRTSFDFPVEVLEGKQEVLNKRTAASKTYIDKYGNYSSVISAGPIHYEKNGNFLEIDKRIVQNTSSAYPFANTTNIFESYFGATSSTGLKNKTSEGELLEFLNTQMYWEVNNQKINVQNSSDVQLTIDGNKAYYNNLYGQISAEFTITEAGRKLNYIIPSAQSLNNIPDNAQYLVFSENIILPFGWSSEMTNSGVLILDNYGKEIYLYQNPFSYDSTNLISEHQNTLYEITQIGNSLQIKTKVDTDWLLSPERQFPLMIDPTVSAYPDDYFFWTLTAREDNVNTGVPNGTFGKNQLGKQLSFHIKFKTHGVVPTGVTINSATGFIYIKSRNGSSPWTREWQWYNSADPQSYSGPLLYFSATTPLSNATSVGGTEWRSNTLSNPDGTDYVKSEIDSPYGNFLSLAVKASGTYSNGDYYTAEDHTSSLRPYIVIDYNLSCAVPIDPVISNIGKTSAKISWTAASPVPSSGYQYYINNTGTEPVESTSPTGTVGSSVTYKDLTGLTANTVYHVWLRSNCNSVKSNWIYAGYFNTDPNQDCFQGDGQIYGTVVNGFGVKMSDVYRAADDFSVPAGKTFTLKQLMVEAISYTNINQAVINVRSDDSGKPGAILNTFSMSPSASVKYTNNGTSGVYHLTFNLPSPYTTYSAGKYWVDITMSNTGGTDVFWRMTNNGSTGSVVYTSNNSGSTWMQNPYNYQAIFYVAGDCDDEVICDPIFAAADKYVLCEGETSVLSVTSSDSSYTYDWFSDWDNETHSGTYLGSGTTINVNPETSSVYGVLAYKSGCDSDAVYDLVSVAVVPSPEEIEVDPVMSINCSNDISQLSIVSGGIISDEAFSETFNPADSEIPWIIRTSIAAGGNIDDASWGLANSDPNISSNDNSVFAVVGSIFSGAYEMESSLISPPVSLADYAAPVNLSFYHVFETVSSGSNFSNAYVEISNDGGNSWNILKHYNTKQGDWSAFANETVNLNPYAGQAYLLFRFRYHSKSDYFWAVDNVKITGDSLPTEISWYPYSGLYTDQDKTQPYNGENLTSVYASPDSDMIYTVSAKTVLGCPVSNEITIENGDKNWISLTDSNWDNPYNWSGDEVPNENHCVKITPGSVKPLIGQSSVAMAKNLVVEAGGGLTIENEGALILQEYLDNQSDEDQFVIKNGGNLIQVDDSAINSGAITVEKTIQLSEERKQYNYVNSPVIGQKIKLIYPGSPTVIYHDENANYFYNAYDGNYIAGRALAVKEPSKSAVSASSVEAQFRGIPFNGNLSFPLSYTTDNPQAGEYHGYNFVGNPYPSSIDLYELYHSNSDKITSEFLLWDNRGNTIHVQQGSDYDQSNYAVFNAASGSGGTGVAAHGASGQSKTPGRYLNSVNGFMLRARPDANGKTVDFNNELRVNEIGVDYHGKNFNQKDDRYWISLISPSEIEMMTAVVYFEGGNNDFAEDDSERMYTSDDIYTFANDFPLVIQGKSEFIINDKIRVGFSAYETGVYRIGLHDFEGVFEEEVEIYLFDMDLNEIQNLKEGPYKFVTREGEYNNRFVIIYRPVKQILDYIQEDIIFAKEVDIFKKDGKIQILSTNEKISDVEVFGLNGSTVYFKSDVNSKEHDVMLSGITKGIIIVTVKMEDGEIISKKFVNN